MKWRNRRRDEIKTIRFWNQWNVDRSSKVIFVGNFAIIPKFLIDYLKKEYPSAPGAIADPLSFVGYKIVQMGPEHASPLPNRRARKNLKWKRKLLKRKYEDRDLIPKHMPMILNPIKVDDIFSAFRIPKKYLEGERSTYLEEKHRDSKLYRNHLFGGFGNT